MTAPDLLEAESAATATDSGSVAHIVDQRPGSGQDGQCKAIIAELSGVVSA